MKRTLLLFIVASLAYGQTANVQKSTATATLNQISGDLTFGSGKTLTMASGSTFSAQAATFAGAIGASNGSAAAPSISFASDTDNGLYLNGANSLGIAAAGSENMRLSASDNWLKRDSLTFGSAADAIWTRAAGGVTLTLSGTNQNITLTPSGTGFVSTFGLRVSTPGSGVAFTGTTGLELTADHGTPKATIRAYDRTNSAYRLLEFDASEFRFSTGAVRFSTYGAGSATFDSSGNITSVSDARMKNITGTFTKGLAEIVKLTPKIYTWKPETGLVSDDVVASLIAQDLIAAGIPEAVSTYRTIAVMEDDAQSAEDIAAGKPVTQHAKLDAAGKPVTQRVDANYSVSDRTVIAALVNAVKELKTEIDALKAR